MRMTRLLAAAVVLALSTTGAVVLAGAGASVAQDSPCSRAGSMPSQGRLTTSFTRASTQNDDRNDYRVGGTLRWDEQDALSCFSAGTVDWAYEHEILYGRQFDRKIWNVDLSSFPDDAGAYVDTTALDRDGVTTLSIGVFRPERLTAGADYSWSYETFLPNDPAGGRQPLTLEGEAVEKTCSRAGPWCVNLHQEEDERRTTFVGEKRGVSTLGSTCWSWTSDGADPQDCGSSEPAPSEPPAAPEPAAPAPAASVPAAPVPAAPVPAAPPPAAPEPAAPDPAPAGTALVAPPPPQAAPPPPETQQEPPPPPPELATALIRANGCNSYGANCDNNPIYADVPQAGYNWRSQPKRAAVPNGTELTARCWGQGGRTTNYAEADPGPAPYGSDVYYYVQVPGSGDWGYIPDTYSARDANGRAGLPHC